MGRAKFEKRLKVAIKAVFVLFEDRNVSFENRCFTAD